MSKLENGWYLRSDGYMTSECTYQRIGAMKGNRDLDNHQKIVFIKYMGGIEVDRRVYSPHWPDLASHIGALKAYASRARALLEETYGLALRFLEAVPDDRKTIDDYVQMERINEELEKLGIEV